MRGSTAYDDLVDAASSIVGRERLESLESGAGEEIRQYLGSNRQVLENARLALKQRCVVPLRNEAGFFSEHSERLPHFRVLAKSFVLELHQARDARDWDAAASIGVDLLTLANAIRRGGLVIDMLISLAIGAIGLEELRTIRANFDESTRKSLRHDLACLAQGMESFPEIAERDSLWEAAVGWTEHSSDSTEPENAVLRDDLTDDQQVVVQTLQSFQELPKENHHALYVMMDRKCIALQRMLFVDLALRSYHAAAGEYPDSLAMLSPAICRRVPSDPFSRESFCYRGEGSDAFLLYSVGPRQTDHHGQFGSWLDVMAGRADFCLDMGDYPLDCS